MDHPEVTIDLNLTDGYVDLVGQGIDFAVRYGRLADSSLKALAFGSNRRIVCASPAYLKAHGTPEHPNDLLRHECIVMRFGENLDRDWPFLVDGAVRRVTVKGRRIANDGGIVRQWCLAGYGLALKSTRDVEDDLASGALVQVLKSNSTGNKGLQIVYAPSAVQPLRVRMLIDQIVEALTDGESERARERGPDSAGG